MGYYPLNKIISSLVEISVMQRSNIRAKLRWEMFLFKRNTMRKLSQEDPTLDGDQDCPPGLSPDVQAFIC